MKIVKAQLLVLALCAVLGFAGRAEAHGTGPHGGQLVDIAPYHLEFQVVSGMLHLYVIDKDQKTVVVEGKATGSLIIQMSDGTKKTVDLDVNGDNLMAIADVKPEAPFTAIATMQMDGKTYTARYAHVYAEAQNEHESH